MCLDNNFSNVIEKALEKYLASHMEDVIPPGLHNRIINEVERVVFYVTLKHAKCNKLQAAKILGINRNTLRRKIAELNIEVDNN
jgi:two-component system nitrogen regulation response regulator GlnG